ncbi:general alpha-glucoside permease-like protein 1 [Elsinoe australis]|uniref:General alpha-glucoside permease-like protein 1 n=1 Tax=Elsinoe australis TaxID=40998 RepID=A0A4U7B6M5_9PEZI|nr:general alpha-glucoside permease-like protein 1 [Elsinoe australis]
MTKSRNNSVVEAVTVDQTAIRRMSITSEKDLSYLNHDAAIATKKEQSMSLLQGIRMYPYAVGWSVFLSTCIVMEGFDKALIYSLFAMDPFKRKFGTQLPDGTYELTAAWQSGLANASLVGEITGLWINGILAERYGYRKTIIGALAIVTACIFLPFFAQNLPTLVAGQVLLGVPFGIFQTITTTYAAEVCPVALRAYLTTYVNLCWVMGQLIASGVLRGVINRTDEWAFRIPFAVQWIWPIPIAIGILFAPESPWWLIRRERTADARAALVRLTSSDPNFNADETVAMMEHTNMLEKAHSTGTSYLDCFKKTDLRRTETVCVTWAIQTMCGGSIMGYSTYFYQNAGLSTEHAFTMSLAQYGLGAIGTILSWFLMLKFGRRTLYLCGQIAMVVLLAVVGGLGVVSRENSGAQWGIGSLILIYTFTYDATVGPVCYSLVAELSSNRLRAKTVVLARILYNLSGLISNVLFPRMINPSAWNWGAKTGFFWACSCALCALWTYFRLPEPKGRTFGELDVLFEQRVSARKFKSTVVNQFGTSEESLNIDEKKATIERVEAA